MRIVLATGGTLGHIFPALKVAKELKGQGHEIFFLGSFKFGQDIIEAQGYKVEDLKARGLNFRNFKQIIPSLWSIIRSSILAFSSLKRIKPQAICGFGGYGAFGVVFAGNCLGVKTIIHEQNVIPGKANMVLSKLVNKVAISFEASSKYFNPKKTVLTGCPINLEPVKQDKRSILERFQLKEGLKTVLVLGGSQGSHIINHNFIIVAAQLKKEIKYNFQVIHACGKTDYPQLKNEYMKLGIPIALFEFLNEMNYAYQVCDLVIARAGAMTINEIAYFKKPAIIIPYPYAGGHQKANAQVLAEAGLASILNEENLTPQRLEDEIKYITNTFELTNVIEEKIKEKFQCKAEIELATAIINLGQ